jgi:hypothetical protein
MVERKGNQKQSQSLERMPAHHDDGKTKRKGVIMSDGFIYNLPFAEYRAINALNASAIKAGRTSMKHMRNAIQSGQEATSAMAKGTLIHSLLLDPDFWQNIVINDDSRNSKAYKLLADECEVQGETILKSEQSDELKAIEASVHANKDAHDLLARCKYEVTATWERGGLGMCKARFDAIADDGSYFIDIKTCSDISPRSVGSQFVNMGYDIQYGWYAFGAEVINGKRPKVYQINIETSAPHDVTVDEVYDESCVEGLRKAVEIATKYRECEQTGVFNGVRDYIARMTLPEWYKETLDMTGDIPFGSFED